MVHVSASAYEFAGLPMKRTMTALGQERPFAAGLLPFCRDELFLGDLFCFTTIRAGAYRALEARDPQAKTPERRSGRRGRSRLLCGLVEAD